MDPGVIAAITFFALLFTLATAATLYLLVIRLTSPEWIHSIHSPFQSSSSLCWRWPQWPHSSYIKVTRVDPSTSPFLRVYIDHPNFSQHRDFLQYVYQRSFTCKHKLKGYRTNWPEDFIYSFLYAQPSFLRFTPWTLHLRFFLVCHSEHQVFVLYSGPATCSESIPALHEKKKN
jgi:hypothetical protein